MRDTSVASSLAITEKRPQQHRPGGCVGIFFHLFDWNRRLAKKKLFSKKLLPPVQRVSKKFGGDHKRPMAKLLLIDDENRGGFPIAKKQEGEMFCSSPDDLGNGMRAPGLVARLMGLESIPTVHHEKPRKALDSKLYYDRDETSEFSRHDQDLCLETGVHGKLELRPQKLQKTGGFFETRPVNASRFGSDVLQFNKGVLSRSRKQQNKLASPVKSPRLLSRRNTARLMEAATKILEPGLQSRNRTKCAITYMSSSKANTERSDANLTLRGSKEPLENPLVGSCKSCGNLVEVAELRINATETPVVEYGSSASDFSNASLSHDESEENKMRPPIITSGPSRTASLAVQAKANVQNRAHDLTEGKSHTRNDPEKYKRKQDRAAKSALKQNNLKHNQMLLVKDKVVPGSKVGIRQHSRRDSNGSNGAKDFVALNRNVNTCTRTRLATKTSDSCRVETERNGLEKNMARKRRPVNVSHTENSGTVGTTFAKQRSARSDLIKEKRMEHISNRSTKHNSVKNELWKQEEVGITAGSKETDVISFTFSSPMRQDARSFSHERLVEKSGLGELTRDASHSKKLLLNGNNVNLASQRGTTLRGDTLSALLEQKIRELTSMDRDELATRDALSGRSTAAILEELISTFTTGAPLSQKNGDSCSGGSSMKDSSYHGSTDCSGWTISNSQMLDINNKYQVEFKAGNSTELPAADSGQPSPMSILDASFSNDSCFSGSFNGCSGFNPHFGSADSSFDQTQSLDLDTDLLDSATSMNIWKSHNRDLSHSANKKSSMHSIQDCKTTIVESSLSYAREAISNAELLLENVSMYESKGRIDSSVDSFLLDTLDTITDAFSTRPKCRSDFREAEGNQLRGCLFDCMIECLDSKYSRLCKSGYKMLLKLPLLLSRDRLKREVQEEIRGWRDLAGKILDEMIEKEMSHSTIEWTEFGAETFETGVEIESGILQALVDEMVIDLWLC